MSRNPDLLHMHDDPAVRTEAATLLSDMSGIRPVAIREGLVDAYVDLSRIRSEIAAVDEEHVQELSILFDDEINKSKSNKTGQLLPVLLGDVPGEPQLLIADGFHRTESLRRRGAVAVYASIRPNLPLGDLIDLRILATSSQQSVQFARIATWIDDAWKVSPWANGKMSPVEAFKMQSLGPHELENTAARFGISLKMAKDMVAWADLKCSQWKVKPKTIQKNLIAAQSADPELVQQVRDSRQGNAKAKAVATGVPVLSSGQLHAIASVVPAEYPLQRVIAGSATLQRLTIAQTRMLARAVGKATSLSQAQQIINSRDWRRENTSKSTALKPEAVAVSVSAPAPAPTPAPAEIRTDDPDITGLRRVIIEEALIVASLRLALKNQRNKPNETVTPPTVELDDAQMRLMGSLLPRLSPLERQVLVLASCFKKSPQVVASVLGCTAEDVRAAILTADKLMRTPEITKQPEGKSFEELIQADKTMILPDAPHRSIFWRDGAKGSRFTDDISVCGLQFGRGEIAVLEKTDDPTLQHDKCGYLAALGLSNMEIAGALVLAEDSVKSQLRKLFKERNVASRTQLAESYIADGTFQIIPGPGPLILTETQATVMQYVAEGLTSHQIARMMCVAEATVRSHLTRIYARNNIHRREQATLAAIFTKAATAQQPKRINITD